MGFNGPPPKRKVVELIGGPADGQTVSIAAERTEFRIGMGLGTGRLWTAIYHQRDEPKKFFYAGQESRPKG